MRQFSQQKPMALNYATLSIMMGMVLEIIGIAVQSLNSINGWNGVLWAHIIMVASAIGSLQYALQLENGRLRAKYFIAFGVLVQLVFMFVIYKYHYLNAFFVAAMMLDITSTFLIFHPATTSWLDAIQNQTEE